VTGAAATAVREALAPEAVALIVEADVSLVVAANNKAEPVS
jgi:hypothetical protein